MAAGLWASTPVTQAGLSKHCTLLLYVPFCYLVKTSLDAARSAQASGSKPCHRKVLLIRESGISHINTVTPCRDELESGQHILSRLAWKEIVSVL